MAGVAFSIAGILMIVAGVALFQRRSDAGPVMLMWSPLLYRRSLDQSLSPQRLRDLGVYRCVLPTVVFLVFVGVLSVSVGIIQM